MELRSDASSLAISAVVLNWPGVTSTIGNRRQLSFRVRNREIGHLHGDAIAHFYFQPELWHRLKAAGRIEDHPVFPGRAGPAQRRIRLTEDLREVVELLRINYDAAMQDVAAAV